MKSITCFLPFTISALKVKDRVLRNQRQLGTRYGSRNAFIVSYCFNIAELFVESGNRSSHISALDLDADRKLMDNLRFYQPTTVLGFGYLQQEI